MKYLFGSMAGLYGLMMIASMFFGNRAPEHIIEMYAIYFGVTVILFKLDKKL